jgi:hypothetical protein
MPPFKSSNPGRPNDLPFTGAEFIAACTAARNGGANTPPEDWQKLMTMYAQIKLLRIDLTDFLAPHFTADPNFGGSLVNSPLYSLFTSDLITPAPTHPFGLPFSVAEYITACQASHDETLPKDFARGVRHLLMAMIHDLGVHKVNMYAFITGSSSSSPTADLGAWLSQHAKTKLEKTLIFFTVLSGTSPEPPHHLDIKSFHQPLQRRITRYTL